MHANWDDEQVRTERADGACLRQRLSFTNVVKGMNAASKRVSQFVTPALSIVDVKNAQIFEKRTALNA
jgi:hypothetical protein